MKKSQSTLTQEKKNETFVKDNKVPLQAKEKKMEMLNNISSPTGKSIAK